MLTTPLFQGRRVGTPRGPEVRVRVHLERDTLLEEIDATHAWQRHESLRHVTLPIDHLREQSGVAVTVEEAARTAPREARAHYIFHNVHAAGRDSSPLQGMLQRHKLVLRSVRPIVGHNVEWRRA